MSSLTHAIGQIFQPLLKAVADVLAFFYSVVPNYPIDIALLTIAIMALLTPLTVKSTKSMAAMQALGPEMKKLQQKYKGAENRMQLTEEMQKLYKEHNVNPASGCLPILLQMPAFLVLYDVIRGITNTVVIHGQVVAKPRYIGQNTKMYHDIVAAHGQLNAFGMDFAEKLFSKHSSIWAALPYLLLVVGAIGLQYLQMSRMNARNPQAAQANPQAAAMQKYMPLIFGLIYLNIAAIINVYFVVSNAIRIATQEVLFRRGMVPGPTPAPAAGAVPARADKQLPKGQKTERERQLPKPGSGGGKDAGKDGPRPAPRKSAGSGPAGGGGKASASGQRGGSNGRSGGAPGGDKQKAHPRSKAKRERRAR